MKRTFILSKLLVASLLAHGGTVASAEAKKPNVILVITDDQGYGDWGSRGKHPYLKTPAMDALAEAGISLTDFHVNPLCTPTRAAVMSGRNAFSVRCWQGRHQLRADAPTLGNLFEENGYKTALFGKWHLGDQYPFRAMDRGFQETVTMVNGMVSTANDYPGNMNLVDNFCKHNGEWKQYPGYSTDVWFDQAIEFIEKNRAEPFFVYLAPDAPHVPHIAPAADVAPYAGIDYPNTDKDAHVAQFYGQIASVDRKLQDLRAKLVEMDLANDTILIFMGDNGSSGASGVWNGGFLGGKGSNQEGGHRVPFFIYWPGGGLSGGRQLDSLAAHVDIAPTLAELCGLEPPAKAEWDGISLAGYFQGRDSELPARTLQFAYAVTEAPPGSPSGCYGRGKYRLFGNGAFFDIAADPLQKNNLQFGADAAQAAVRTQMLADAKAHHELMVKTVYPFDDPAIIGNPAANPTILNASYGRTDGEGKGYTFLPTLNTPTGRFHRMIVKADVGGDYEVSLYRWPQIWKWAGVPIRGEVGKGTKFSLDIRQARLQFSDAQGKLIFDETKPVSDTDSECKFTIPDIPAGVQMNIKSWFIGVDGTNLCTPIEMKIYRTSTGE